MIIQQATKGTVTNVMDSAEFGIQNSGKMFKMVISGLYSKKAESITREIWSNAFDAHCMKGTPDRPFEVTLPSTFRPEFKVRDFGEGLSYDWMKKNYTILGHSSKENTNLAVGKWGVGRMSPMSYTDTFSVVSIHEGIKTSYNVTMEGSGEPRLNVLIPPMETEEESGLEISFPVARPDYQSFIQAANRVSLGFNVKPVVIGQKSFEWPKFERNTEGEGYSTFSVSGMGIGTCLIQMGCVIYPVNLNELDLDYNTKSIIQQMRIIMDVPIGAVEVTASREDLSYGPKEPTKNYLRGRVMGIVASLVKDASVGLDKCKTPYEAFQFIRNSGLPHSLKTQLKWGDYDKLHSSYTMPYVTAVFHKNYTKAVKTSTRSTSQSVNAIFVSYNKGPKNDVRAEARVRSWVVSTGTRVEYTLLVRLEWDKETKTYVEDDLTKVKQFFGTSLVRNVSDLSDVTPVKRTASKAKAYDAFWNDIEVDMDQGGFYFESYSGNVEGVGYRYHGLNYKSIPEIGSKQVVIVPKTLWKRFEANDKWTKIVPTLKKWVEGNIKPLQEVLEKSNYRDGIGLQKRKDMFSGIIKTYYNELDKVKDSHVGFNHYQCSYLIDMFSSAASDVSSKPHTLDSLEDKIYRDYPLLDCYQHSITSKLDAYTQYVLALDAFRAKNKS